MQEQNKPADAQTPQPNTVAAGTEHETKQKTEPLRTDNNGRDDKNEGDMDNGELGAELKKEE